MQMISETALKHFDQLWILFDRSWLDAKGSMFLIEPFQHYFPTGFVDKLTEEEARIMLHKSLLEWGKIEQQEHEVEIRYLELPDGRQIPDPRFKDPKVRWSRSFILTAYYDLCCLATHKKSIEELIYIANKYRNREPEGDDDIKAFYKLVGISKSFLLAEWTHGIISRAVSKRDEEFFKGLCKWLKEDTSTKRFDTARIWLGTTLLWYLGGKDITPRRNFMLLLRKKGIISSQLDELSFNAMLSKLRLLRDLVITK